jgi:hypothetical protein
LNFSNTNVLLSANNDIVARTAALLLLICVLANQYVVYRLSEAENEKCCYELHARRCLRFIIRLDTAKLQQTVASPKTRVPQDLSTHTKEPISLQKASECAQSHVTISYGKCGSLGDVGVIVVGADMAHNIANKTTETPSIPNG